MTVSKIKKKFFVLGLGISGLSTALFLKKKSQLTISWDDNSNARKFAKTKNVVLKNEKNFDLTEVDFIVASPIINHNKKNINKIIDEAKKKKIKIISDLELINIFNLDNLKIGVTGTNGKSTTTKFIESTLSLGKKRAIACGNIGLPIASVLNKIKKSDILVVESSSYQLDKIDLLKFDIAILLNLANDHLDWHSTFKNYKSSKLKIFENQDKNCFSIICLDDKNCKKIAKEFSYYYNSSLIKISTTSSLKDGIYLKKLKDGIKIFNNLNGDVIFLKNNLFKFTLSNHNFQNLLATYAVNYLLDKSSKKFEASIKKIKNLEHRIEFVGKYKNLCFYNDSKATNLESSQNAIQTFSNIYWILGGRKKTGGLTGIDKYLKNVLSAFCIGECGEDFNNFLKKRAIESVFCKELNLALFLAVRKALKEKKIINILFSPACSSFDQFSNFEDRGKKFKLLVKKITNNEKV